LRLGVRSRYNDAELETNTYTQQLVTINYDLAQPVIGTRLSVSMGLGAKTYDEFSVSLDGRRDRYVSLGISAGFEDISYFGFSPILSVSATQTKSNVDQFSILEVTGRLGIQSNF